MLSPSTITDRVTPKIGIRYCAMPATLDPTTGTAGWFFTGDYAKYDEDGYIWFLGRKDDIIKSFGYRVSPYEIERVFKSHPDVADCAAIGEEIEKDKLLVVTYILPHEGKDPDPNELLKFGQNHLAAYKAPKTIYIAHEFPKTKNGKILRKNIDKSIAVSQSTVR